MTSLNPVLTIGTQIKEVLFLHKQLSDKEATEKAVELLNLVGIPFAQKRLKDYPPSIQWRYASTCDDCNGTCL